MGWSDEYPREESIPTYEESMRQKDFKNTPPAKPQTLAERLLGVQRKRIQSLVDNKIDPLLNDHAESGLFKAAFALILSDVSLLQHGADGEAAIDTLLKFPDDVYTSVVRLEGEENSSRFWRQDAVIRDLEKELHYRLRIDAENSPSAKPIKVSKPPQSPEPQRGIWSLFGKSNQSKTIQPPQIPMFTQADAGWKAESHFPLDTSQTSLRVTTEEVFVRVQTDLGLYQTRGCSALVIRLQVGR